MKTDLAPIPGSNASTSEGEKAAADVVLRVWGVVQGVGFRPFVHRTASKLGVRGWVKNDSKGVLIRAIGSPSALAELMQNIRSQAPPAARVFSVETREAGAEDEAVDGAFAILPSEPAGKVVETVLPPDLALCVECRRELLDPLNRRFHYPFINCTQCGPRYSILERLPYDRPNTTMRSFPMCAKCREEYDNSGDRRFHAQPNACPVCGPRAVLRGATGEALAGGEPIEQARRLIESGGVVAVKGVGGYHLMVDAGNEKAVAELRRRKHRDEKPFAVMFPDLESVRAAAEVTPEAETFLASTAAPIVLLKRLPGAALAAGIAPGNPWVGALLPYAPLQVLLLEALGRPVVATSGNLAEEPLCIDEVEAHARLAGIADAFLDHDRPIAHPVDDSVVRFAASGPILLRRARGYAPGSLLLPGRIDGCLMCVGAQMKNTVAVASGNRLVLSPHLGDLDGAATLRAFRRTADMLAGLHGSKFTGVVCDRHPDYASTRYAEDTGLPRLAVQHHLAHVLACLLEHGREADGVLGIAWDGTGYGEDGTVWGGEFILLKKRRASRFGRLRPFRLPGGDAAARDGRRSALGLLHEIGDVRFDEFAGRMGISVRDSLILGTALTRRINAPAASSVGRLFDAVGALLGIGGQNSFEGQTPLAVEAAALSVHADGRALPLPLPLRAVPAGGGAIAEMDWQPLLEALLSARARGCDEAHLAAAFHRSLAHAIVAMACAAGAGTVALSGGCFQNALLLDLAVSGLENAGFEVLVPRELPPNDGSIAAGQALGALLGLTSVDLP